ncbi:MAG: flagellar hook-length control protein FliK, partial [Candidatus Competibacteraceae bacterium]
EPTTPAALNLRNPVAPLIAGRTEQTAPIPPPEPTALAALNLRNPVAPLITGRTEQTASIAPTPPLEPTTPAALNLRNPVAPLITGRTEQTAPTAPTPPPEPTAPAALNLRNPVAPLATLAKPDRIEPGPLNPVAPLAGTDKTSPLTAANVKTTPVVRHTDQTIENNAITRNENAAAVRDRVAASLPGLQSALAPLLRPQMHIAAPFTRYTAESEPLAEDRAGPAEPAAWLDDAPPPNAVKPERPATPFTPVSASLPDIGQVHRSPAELAVTPVTSHHEPAILDATTTPLTVEPATVPPAGSPPQAGLSSAVAPARPDAATPSTALPTTPDTVDLNQKNWGRTLGHQLNWMVNNQLQQAEIRVNPPDLGPIELRVSLQNNQTSVTFFCHESAVREALENALPRLREMLDSQGISLNQAQVSDQSLARQQAGGGGGQPSFGQRDDQPPAHPPIREPVATETAPRPRARRLPGTVDDYA